MGTIQKKSTKMTLRNLGRHRKYQLIIHSCQYLHGIIATIQTSPSFFSLVVGSPPLLLGFHHSSRLLSPPFPLVLPTSWLKNSSKSPSLLILLHLSPSSTYPIKTLSNSHQQTTSSGSFRLKLSLSVTTSLNLSMALTLVYWPRLAPQTKTHQIHTFFLGFDKTCFSFRLLSALSLLR